MRAATHSIIQLLGLATHYVVVKQNCFSWMSGELVMPAARCVRELGRCPDVSDEEITWTAWHKRRAP